MKKILFSMVATGMILSSTVQAQDREDNPANMGSAPGPKVHQATAHHDNSTFSTVGKGIAKGAEYTGRGLGTIVCGTLGFAGGFVVGTGYSLYLAFPIKFGCGGVYGIHTQLTVVPPIYFGAKGAKLGVQACW